MERKLRTLILALSALLGSLFCSSNALADDPFYGISATFTPIGDEPNITWTQGFSGFLDSIDTGGIPNVLVDLSDTSGISLEHLPATLYVRGYYKGYNVSPRPSIQLYLSLIYAGQEPLVVQGNSFTAGAHLLDTFSLFFLGENGEGHSGLAAGLMHSDVLERPGGVYGILADYQFSPTFDVNLVHYLSGDYPFTMSGSGQLSGVLSSGAVPELSTWALLVGGFGIAGIGLRRRNASAATRASLRVLAQAVHDR